MTESLPPGPPRRGFDKVDEEVMKTGASSEHDQEFIIAAERSGTPRVVESKPDAPLASVIRKVYPMRRLLSVGAAASVLALIAAGPAMANPPDLQLQPGNGPAPSAQGAPGGNYAPGGQQFGGGRRGGGGDFNRGGGGYRQYGGGGYRGGYGDGYRRRGGYGYGGAAVGAGIAGLAAGAIIGGAIANQRPYYEGYPATVYEPDVVEAEPVAGDEQGYCASRYRSYDPRSGTYLGFDGLRHPCP